MCTQIHASGMGPGTAFLTPGDDEADHTSSSKAVEEQRKGEWLWGHYCNVYQSGFSKERNQEEML